MANSASKRWRAVLVATHVLTSVGWMAMALAQTTLVAHGIGAAAPTRYAAYAMAEYLDVVLLAAPGRLRRRRGGERFRTHSASWRAGSR